MKFRNLRTGAPQKGGESINQLTWLDLKNLPGTLREFEYWSQLCLTEFLRKAIRNQPSFLIRRRTPFRGRHILCIMGGIGSGKSAATNILTQEFGYREINSGQVVARLLRISTVQSRQEKLQRKSWRFISSERGPSDWHLPSLKAVKQSEQKALIDGIRQRNHRKSSRNRRATKVRLCTSIRHRTSLIPFMRIGVGTTFNRRFLEAVQFASGDRREKADR